jgi:hypothetical protein
LSDDGGYATKVLAEYSRLQQVAKGVSVPFFSPQIIVVQSPAVELPAVAPEFPLSVRTESDVSPKSNGFQSLSIQPEPEKTKAVVSNQQQTHTPKLQVVDTVALVSVPSAHTPSGAAIQVAK